MLTLLHRIARAARLKHHDLAERQARRMLATAAGDDFDVVRARVLELELCPDPLACSCLEAKPLRKLVQG